MNLRRLALAGGVLGVLLAVAGGVATGVTLAQRANVPEQREVVLVDPGTVARSTAGLRSPGGFTGFDGAAALAGNVTRSGELARSADGALAVTSAGASMGLRPTSNARFYRIVRASTPLAAGDLVQVRLDEAGAPTGVLRLPADLHETAAPESPRGPAATPAP